MVWLPWLFRWMFLAIFVRVQTIGWRTSFGLCGFWHACARINAARFRPNHSVPLAFARFAIVGGLAVMAWAGMFTCLRFRPIALRRRFSPVLPFGLSIIMAGVGKLSDPTLTLDF